jgi:hypothetical protein
MKLFVLVISAVFAIGAMALVLNVFPELRNYKELVGLGCGLMAGRASKVTE